MADIPTDIDPLQELPLEPRLRRIAASQQYMTSEQGENQLVSNYGIHRREVSGMLIAQKGLCACCTWDLDKPKPGFDRSPKWAIDHEGERGWRGNVRGILCYGCNTGIGKIGGKVRRADGEIVPVSTEVSIEKLRAAIAYLERALARRPKL